MEMQMRFGEQVYIACHLQILPHVRTRRYRFPRTRRRAHANGPESAPADSGPFLPSVRIVRTDAGA
ncbi:hypothetical protein GCM10009574_061890 [Streptomyces asiaticus]|uniref:Uncharacterized protein n=2 Tax=Streptomyces rhizosphaericus TaxID=114699 RepID=A0ABN1S8I5_9ACTN